MIDSAPGLRGSTAFAGRRLCYHTTNRVSPHTTHHPGCGLAALPRPPRRRIRHCHATAHAAAHARSCGRSHATTAAPRPAYVPTWAPALRDFPLFRVPRLTRYPLSRRLPPHPQHSITMGSDEAKTAKKAAKKLAKQQAAEAEAAATAKAEKKAKKAKKRESEGGDEGTVRRAAYSLASSRCLACSPRFT